MEYLLRNLFEFSSHRSWIVVICSAAFCIFFWRIFIWNEFFLHSFEHALNDAVENYFRFEVDRKLRRLFSIFHWWPSVIRLLRKVNSFGTQVFQLSILNFKYEGNYILFLHEFFFLCIHVLFSYSFFIILKNRWT